MKLEYDVTVEDLVAFSRFHLSKSPSYKRMIWTVVIVIGILLSAFVLAVPSDDNVRRLFVLAGTIVLYTLFTIVIFQFFPKINDWQVRRFLQEGGNKGVIGTHELEIDEHGLLERTEVNETRLAWKGIDRIVDLDKYAYIYVSALQAHVIPKEAVVEGDPDAFLSRAKQLWQAACPDRN